ncbi:MAG TPA: LysM peptidoglycan-binding domain-containing protein [Victivallales bacterium]|nr:LysM peptidoglycan-binding domain-containing protein [Victivallales bacterium]
MKLFKNKITLIIISIIITYFTFTSISFSQNTNSRNYQVQIITLLKNNETKLNTLTERFKYLQDNYVTLNQDIKNLDRDLRSEQQKNRQLKNEIAILKQQINKDRKYMQNSLNRAVDKIANETSKAINSRAYSAQKIYNNKQSLNTNNFYKYKVQPGATLSAISKAYKVSVNSIRKANKLDSDIIKVGQTLYIPKK